MSNLHDIQRRFKQALQEPAGIWTPDALSLRDQPPVPFLTRVAIYHYAYLARLAEAIREDFDGVAAWLGEAQFSRRMRPFLQEHPSVYKTISEVSRPLPQYLRDRAQPSDPEFLPDLAQFEWMWVEAAVTDNRPPNGTRPLADLPTLDLSTTSLVLNPSLRLFESRWPVDKLIRKRDGVQEHATRLALFSHADSVTWIRLRPRQWEVLKRLEAAPFITDLLAFMLEQRIRPDQTQKWFSDWAARGMILGVRPSSPPQ